MRSFRQWRWHLDEVYVKINGEVLESYVTRTRDKQAALAFMKKALKRHGCPETITTDGLRSYRAAMKPSATPISRRCDAGPKTGRRTTTCRSEDESGQCSGSGE